MEGLSPAGGGRIESEDRFRLLEAVDRVLLALDEVSALPLAICNFPYLSCQKSCLVALVTCKKAASIATRIREAVGLMPLALCGMNHVHPFSIVPCITRLTSFE